jgi:hypothetical protein
MAHFKLENIEKKENEYTLSSAILIGILLAAVPVLPGKKKIGFYSSSPATK